MRSMRKHVCGRSFVVRKRSCGREGILESRGNRYEKEGLKVVRTRHDENENL